jgi:NADP-dependent 3-hydroxy acid dehydrogenase YdfG
MTDGTKGKIVVVTGASSGLGEAAARLLSGNRRDALPADQTGTLRGTACQ